MTNHETQDTMLLTEYLDQKNILWQPLNLSGKMPIKVDTWLPKANDYKTLGREEIIKRQNIQGTKYIAIYTDEINQCDIDIQNYDLPETDMPYYLSISKKLKHYFMHATINYEKNKTNVKKFKAGDILTGQWAYAKRDALVFNATKEIRQYNFTPDDVKVVKYDILEDVTNRLINEIGPNCDYETWFKIITALYNESFYIKELEDKTKLSHKFSQNSPKYDEKATDTINNLKFNQKGNSIKTLYYLLKQNEKKSETKSDIVEDSYIQVKAEFEKNHCKIINQTLFVVETKDGIITHKEQNLKIAYRNLKYYTKVKDELKEMSFITKWLEDPTNRSYTTIGCFPPTIHCPDNVYNVWIPFRIESITPSEPQAESIELLKNHFFVLCGKEQSSFDYFIRWLAHSLKIPHEKTTCPVFISNEGAGKGTALSIIRKIMGSNKVCETTDPANNIWGTFNSILANTYLVVLNELSKKDTINSIGKIKGLITDTELTINEKNRPQYTINSYHKFMIFTNNDDPIVSKKDDRRNFIMRSSDEFIGNTEYFTKIHKLIEDDSVIRGFYDYLMEMDVSGFKQEKIPKTAYQQGIQDSNTEPVEEWIKHITATADTQTVKMNSKEYAESYKEFCEARGFKRELNSLKLSRQMDLYNKNEITVKKTTSGNSRIFDIEKLRKFYKIGEPKLDWAEGIEFRD